MADHHVDSLNINYTKAAKHILQSHGLYIANAPDINHKPGNDFYSDWTWPFPTYPDNRFQNPTEDNLDIKDNNKDDKKPETPDERRKFPENFQILSEELKSLKNIKNPMVSNLDPHDGENFINGAVYPYTGLVIQAQEKRAYDISFVKPYFEDGERKTRLLFRELVTGHFYSIATYDGWRYHIYRGLLVCMPCTRQVDEQVRRKVYSHSIPYGLDTLYDYPQNLSVRKKNPVESEITSKHMHVVLDCSEFLNGELESIPLNQIIDVEPYDFTYDFTIYEGNLKVNYEDWFITRTSEIPTDIDFEEFVYIPTGGILPQTLYHEVIEHQYKDKCKYWNCNHNR